MPLRFSKRLDWSIAPNLLTQTVEKQRAAGARLLDLTQSNPTTAGIPYPPMHELLGNPGFLRYEPSAKGLLAARQAVSDYYGRAGVEADRILLTASTSESYSFIFKLLCDPGDEVLVPRPSYPLFDMLARLESVNVVQYPIHYDHGWFVDVAALRLSITPRTRAIAWVNPNNPTGSFLKRQEYSAIAEMCNQHGLALISDEVFADYRFEDSPESLYSLVDAEECFCLSLSGLSKVCGLPQMKLGWIVASGPGHAAALDRLEWIADTFLSVGAPVQYAASALLAGRHHIQHAIRERTRENLDLLQSTFKTGSCRALHVEGGWYAILSVPSTLSEEDWTLQLLQKGVLVQPGYFFDFESEAYLVLSLLTESATFREGVEHILNAC
jgi:aspartate/methionine/tyrosine aminotransferase